MAYSHPCPDCGANLDPGEVCDCKKEKEDAPADTGTPSRKVLLDCSLSEFPVEVNACVHLRDVRAASGATGKQLVSVVKDAFPKFNRQLLAQLEAPEKYGAIIHPNALRLFCDAYGVEIETAVKTAKPRKQERRKLPHKLTVRISDHDFALLQLRIEKDGYGTVQSWVHAQIKKALEGDQL